MKKSLILLSVVMFLLTACKKESALDNYAMERSLIQIILSTQVLDEIEKQKEQQGSRVFYAHIPKEFLTEESYDGWVTP